MTLEDVLSEIRLELTGNVIELELTDETLKAIVHKALRELDRYWDETTLIVAPFASCIDYSSSPDGPFKEEVNSIAGVYRTEGVGDASGNVGVMTDPLYMSQFALFSNGGTMYNLNDYVMNYASWATVYKIKNTMSTDLSWKEDRHNKKLYINRAMTSPSLITIEYIPKLTSVEVIKSDYWKDILVRLCVAFTKITVGRIRTRFTQSNALWTQDGDRILEEGNTELKELREVLRVNSNLIQILD